MTKKARVRASRMQKAAMDIDQTGLSEFLPDFDEINKFFESALNTIPAQIYFASPAVHIQPAVKNNRFIHKKSGLEPSQHKFRKSGKEKCEEKSIVEIQKEAFLEEAETKPTSIVSNPGDLKERLHEKIRELTGKRKRDPSKPEKRQRNKMQKLSGTEKAELTASKKAAQRAKAENANKPSENAEKPQKSEQSKPNKGKKMDITIANVDVGAPKKNRKNKAKYGDKKARLEVALKRAESEKAELEKLSPAERITKQTEISTKLALLKAQGVKIRNDPNLIKKSLKAHESKKRHSAKKWSQRNQKQAKESQQKANAIRQSIEP